MILFREHKTVSWVSFMESGIWEHCIADVNPDPGAWDAITSIDYVEALNSHIIPDPANDYQNIKLIIDDIRISRGWANLSDSEKYAVIKYYGYRDGDMDKVVFLMSQGMTQAQAQYYLVESWHKHHAKFVEACNGITGRWYYTKREVIMRVDKAEIEAFCSQVETPVFEYISNGIIGSQYGDSNTGGIMDFMESTGDYVGDGFAEQEFTLNPGVTNQQVIDAVKNVIVNGYYERYD